MAFFCADEPEASSWPLASSHLMLRGGGGGGAAAAGVAGVVGAARREGQGAGDGESTEGEGPPVHALKLHLRGSFQEPPS
ncbi:hypothetical protein SALBM311S_01328 [Streptomyces alboniger]